jgi:hypothetical protein
VRAAPARARQRRAGATELANEHLSEMLAAAAKQRHNGQARRRCRCVEHTRGDAHLQISIALPAARARRKAAESQSVRSAARPWSGACGGSTELRRRARAGSQHRHHRAARRLLHGSTARGAASAKRPECRADSAAAVSQTARLPPRPTHRCRASVSGCCAARNGRLKRAGWAGCQRGRAGRLRRLPQAARPPRATGSWAQL